MRRLILLAATFLAVAAAPAGAADGAGAITVKSRTQLDARLAEYRLSTPALPQPTIVRVLLPDGYDANADRRYPVLYLLHGCCDVDVDGAQAWTVHGKAEQITAGKDVIVVMPAGGRGGMYSDWRSAGSQGRPQWETFHMHQLLPWVDATFRTRAERDGRVIAGLSMGGFGALKYAATYPDQFVAAASFSGIVDSNVDAGAVHAALPALDGGTPASVWGLRATDEIRWRSENPVDLADNLRPLSLTIRTGNGLPGPLDGPVGAPDGAEIAAHQDSVSLHERLATLNIPHVWDDYGPGTHTWPYWSRDLEQTLPGLLGVLDHPPAPPARVSYRSARPAYEVFGWRVDWHRTTLAFTHLLDADRRGFVLEGPGAATVRTPGGHAASSKVTVDGAPVPVASDSAGRLTIPIESGTAKGAVVRIAGPSCRPAGIVTVTVPRRMRHARATIAGRRAPLRHRKVRVKLRTGTVKVVLRGRSRRGRALRIVRRYRVCGAAR